MNRLQLNGKTVLIKKADSRIEKPLLKKLHYFLLATSASVQMTGQVLHLNNGVIVNG